MNFVIAFFIGGIICSIGQILLDKTRLTPARIMVGYVVCGTVLGAFGIYDKLVDFAGAGATVPLLGFGNTLAKGAIDAVKAQGLFGIFSGALSSAAAGIAAAIVFGYIFAMIFSPKEK